MDRFEEGLCRRAFRRADFVTLTAPDGTEVPGRGFVAALRGEAAQPGGQRHPLGTLTRPLARFTGWLARDTELTGGVMEQAGVRYRVLDCRAVTLGSKKVCTRCLLEREEECA